MIKVSVLYPNEEGKKFDMDYYTGKHMPMVHSRLDSMGLLRTEVERGVSSADPNAPAPFVAIGVLYFNTAEEVHEGFKTHGREIMGDIPNYTDIAPQFQISEIV
ncbi:MAG: EthD family reductase [Bacteroidetes bacterium]|nr:EthD family reductase [Bacteroidota bacterium]